MAHATIYFDESGNTGQDMLNKEQKVFVLASVNYDNQELEKIKSIFNINEEVHFKKLKNSSIGRKKIISFLNHELISEQHVVFSVAHKEFNVCGQITDLLIETVMFERGFDLYVGGRNIAYANWIFYFGNFFWDKTLYNKLVEEFVNMIRTKSKDSISKFYSISKELFNSIKEKSVLEPVLESQKHIDEIMDSIDKYSIDVTFSTFLVLCNQWYKKTKHKINVKLDTSKQIEHYKHYLDHTNKIAEISPEVIEIGYDSRKITFPPQIHSIEMVESKNEFGVQCADLIASAISFMYNNETGKFAKFSKEIQESKLLQLSNAHVIWPTDDVSPKALGMDEGKGINPIDFMATNLNL